MKVSLFVCLVLLCPIAASAQATATTPDGKKVILKSDGTWKYAEGSSSKETVTLKIEVGIVYETGQALPAARAPFALLDADPKPELMALPLQTDSKFNGIQQLSATCRNVFPEARDVVRKHSKYTFTLGFDGKAEVRSIEPGKYWLFGITMASGVCVMWLKEVDLTSDQNLVLDQRNTR